MLPVLNEKAVRYAVLFGLGIDAEIGRRSVFDRKNYFYPDLPKGYQISQFDHPIVGRGKVEIQLADGHYRNDRLQTYIIPTSMDAHRTWLRDAALYAVAACGLAASVVYPMDWGRAYQLWPIPTIYGVLAGFCAGQGAELVRGVASMLQRTQ